MLRQRVLLPILLLGAVLSSRASAGLSARLVYLRSGTAESCPDQSALKKAVARRLGYDPFFVSAPYTIVAEMSGSGGQLRARARLLDEAGIVQGSRELLGKSADCSELLASLALAISLTLDPMAALTEVAPERQMEGNEQAITAGSTAADTLKSPPGQPAEMKAEPAKSAVSSGLPGEDVQRDKSSLKTPGPDVKQGEVLAENQVRAKSVSTRRRLSLGIHVGALGSLGFVPTASPTLSLGIYGRRQSLALGAEGATVYSQERTLENGLRAEVALHYFALVPCYMRDAAGLCGFVNLGRYSARGGGVDAPAKGGHLHASAGLRFLGSVPITSQWSLKMAVTGVRVMSRPWFVVAEQKVYRPPEWAANLGVFLAFDFF